jgi:hypothetical protein
MEMMSISSVSLAVTMSIVCIAIIAIVIARHRAKNRTDTTESTSWMPPPEFVEHKDIVMVGETLQTMSKIECRDACLKNPRCTHYVVTDNSCALKDRKAALEDRLGIKQLAECKGVKCSDGYKAGATTYTHSNRLNTDQHRSLSTLLRSWRDMTKSCDSRCIGDTASMLAGAVTSAIPFIGQVGMIARAASIAAFTATVGYETITTVKDIKDGPGFFTELKNSGKDKDAFIYHNIPADQVDRLVKGMKCISQNCVTYTGLNTTGTVGGGKKYTGNLGFGSDRRAKTHVAAADLQRCYDVVRALRLHAYAWDETRFPSVRDRHQLGFMAQEVQQYFPKSVTIEDKHGFVDFHSLDPDQLYKCLFGAVQHMQAEIDALKKELQRRKKKRKNT